MANAEELIVLRKHIQELSNEILNVKRLINPYISTQEYKQLHAKFQSLSNLKLIAKNELEASMYHYKIVLSGRVIGPKNMPVEKVLRRKIKLELDCKLQISRNLDLSISSHKEMYMYIYKTYAELFQDAKFRIRSVMQLK